MPPESEPSLADIVTDQVERAYQAGLSMATETAPGSYPGTEDAVTAVLLATGVCRCP